MKTTIASLLRHAFTALASLGGLLLSYELIDAGDVTSVNAAGASLSAALVVIITAVIARLVLTLTGKIFSAGSGELSGSGPGVGPGLLLVCGTAVGAMGCLPSCSTEQMVAWKSVPIRACYMQDGARVCYSPKAGIEIDVDRSSEK